MGWREFKFTPPVDYVDKEDYVTPELVLNPHNPLNPPRVSEKLVDENQSEGIDSWLSKIMRADTADDVLNIVDSFRPLPWTDEERARMSRTYMARLNGLAAREKEPSAVAPVKPVVAVVVTPKISKWEKYRRAKEEAKARRLQDAAEGWWAND